MNKPILAITGEFQIPSTLNIDQIFDVIHIPVPKSYLDILNILSQCEYYILGGPEFLDKSLLVAAKSLKAIGVMGTGTASFVDVASAYELGISIYNVPKINAQSVAEFAYSIMYVSNANIFNSIEKLKIKKEWFQKPRPDFTQLHFGIIGMGECAKALISILKKNNILNISYFSRTRNIEFEKEMKIKYLELPELSSCCDIISIHVTMNESSRYLISTDIFSNSNNKLKLFNFSNPRIVDPLALKNALIDSKLDFFFLDGYYNEWVDIQNEDFGLLDLGPEKFIATSHIAAQEESVVVSVFEHAYQSILTHFNKTLGVSE